MLFSAHVILSCLPCCKYLHLKWCHCIYFIIQHYKPTLQKIIYEHLFLLYLGWNQSLRMLLATNKSNTELQNQLDQQRLEKRKMYSDLQIGNPLKKAKCITQVTLLIETDFSGRAILGNTRFSYRTRVLSVALGSEKRDFRWKSAQISRNQSLKAPLCTFHLSVITLKPDDMNTVKCL